jgi:hypothetical protein
MHLIYGFLYTAYKIKIINNFEKVKIICDTAMRCKQNAWHRIHGEYGVIDTTYCIFCIHDGRTILAEKRISIKKIIVRKLSYPKKYI